MKKPSHLVRLRSFSTALGCLLAGLSACHPHASIATAKLTSGSATATGNAAGSTSAIAARIGDRVITLSDVDKKVERELYDVRAQALDELVSEQVVDAAAKQAGLPVDEFVRKAAEAKMKPITEAEAQTFFDANKDRLPEQLAGKSFEEVKPVIIAGLTRQNSREAAQSVVEELRSKAKVQVLYRAPVVQVAAVGPSRGPKDAKVTIVEFSDFQCPYCARGRSVLDQVVKAYGSSVRVVFRDYPLPFHDHAEKAAEAGRCAEEQGKFWALHDWMFDHQEDLTVDELGKGARGVGLDGARFDACLASGKFEGAIKESVKAGEEVGVHGTPAFFINGNFLNGAQPFEKFKEVIDAAVASDEAHGEGASRAAH